MKPPKHHFASAADVDLATFATLCEQPFDAADYPTCSEIHQGVAIYDGPRLLAAAAIDRRALLSELHALLDDGPGVMVIRGAYPDPAVVRRHSEVFEAILDEERQHGVAADHFAKAGANGRIWNALQKAALRAPQSFIEYYANPLIDLAAQAWLGPGYQVTAQVNVVYPGGQAQQPHRDYHLGFQSNDVAALFPLPLHRLSRNLTLQGAIAHSEMPIESGPTQLLPGSQRYDAGYLAWRDPAFIDYFQRHTVQLPLRTGDMLFFNPALFHAAGTNRTTDQVRMANLLQISSAFGKPMESLDRDAMVQALYPALLEACRDGNLDAEGRAAVIAAAADGYAFPTNLDNDPPLEGLAPQTGQQLLAQALEQRLPVAQFAAQAAAQHARRQP